MLRNLARLLRIQHVMIRFGLEDLLLEGSAWAPLKHLAWLSPARWGSRDDRERPRAERIRMALEELGPVFVKLGQVLSTRRDLLPDDIGDELSKLQDQVRPFAAAEARNLIEDALGDSVDALFIRFEAEPMASASIAQVHAARLPDGQDVVVKVLRPGIKAMIDRDVGLMYVIAALAERTLPDGKRLRPREVVSEYDKTIHDELDLTREAANATLLRRNFKDSEKLYVPEVHWDYTRRNVLVLERIHGIPIRNVDEMRAMGMNMHELALHGVEIFYTQVFHHNFFHADMHPGNIFVSPENLEDPQYIAVDFGIVGSLTEQDQHYLGENFLAFYKGDYRRVAQLHVDSGWVPPDTRVDEFESAIRLVCEPIFEKPLAEISFGHVLLQLFQTARRFNMEIQPQLVLLQKTLLNIEGLGRRLYPDLDLWATGRPFLEEWTRQRHGPEALLKKLREEGPEAVLKSPEVPRLVHQWLSQQVNHGVGGYENTRVRDREQRDLRALRRALAGASVFLGGALFGAAEVVATGAVGWPVLILLGGGALLLVSALR